MNKEEKEFLEHLWKVLNYDTSEGAPPIHQQFYERHKEALSRAVNTNEIKEAVIPFEDLPIEEKRKRWRQYNKTRHLKNIKKRFG